MLITLLAGSLGLPAVEADLLRIGEGTACLVRRYDRVRDRDGRLVRLHQEDLCQALGLGPGRKYEAEGGPSFARCFRLFQEASSEPLADAGSLLEWMVFNVIAGNADGHAKNLAILYGEDGSRRLAPAYDLVCTRAYAMLDRRLAMAVGSTRDPGAIDGSHFTEMARLVGIGPRFLLDLVDRMLDRMPGALAETSKRFAEKYGDSPALQMVNPIIRKQVRRLRLSRKRRT